MSLYNLFPDAKCAREALKSRREVVGGNAGRRAKSYRADSAGSVQMYKTDLPSE